MFTRVTVLWPISYVYRLGNAREQGKIISYEYIKEVKLVDGLPEIVAGMISGLAISVPVSIPLVLAFVTSTYDGTFDHRGKFAAKVCFAGVPFDVWGITTLLRGNASLGAPPTTLVTELELGSSLVFLLFIHIGFNAWCLKGLARLGWEKTLTRFFIALVSVTIPALLLFPKSFI